MDELKWPKSDAASNSNLIITNNKQLATNSLVAPMERVHRQQSKNKIEIHANKNEIITFQLIEVKQTSTIKRLPAVHIIIRKCISDVSFTFWKREKKK